MKKIWFITGSSRGLGRSLTEAVLVSGDVVAAAARNPAQLDDLLAKYPSQLYPIQLDVTDYANIPIVVKDIVGRFGRIDVLVNNAGFGITGAAEAFTDEQVRSQLETNLYAPIQITRVVLPYMRAQRAGHIIEVSSIGGRIGNAGVSIYQAAKFGLSGFSESLAREVAPLGIKVTCVEPGGFRTDWAGASMTFAAKVPGYELTVDYMAEHFRGGHFIPMGDPDKAAAAMIQLVKSEEPPVHLVLGSEAAAMLKLADQARSLEFEKWMPVTLSTDHADAVNFMETDAGRHLAGQRG